MEVKLSVPAVEKLLEYSASGIGSVAGPMLASWKARKEAEAKLIAAKGEVAAQRILTEGQATTMDIIATAQADARSILVSPDSTVRGELDFSNTVAQRIQFQEEKRQSNIETVVRRAASELEGKNVEDHEPDHDWTARFFSDVQDVSSEEMQQLWGKILAGEIERPGNTSMKTLGVLKNLDKGTATIFRRLCSTCVLTKPDGYDFIDARVPSLGKNAGSNALKKYGLAFGNLNVLNEHGLIISDYNSWYDVRASIGIALEGIEHTLFRFPFYFQDKYWILIATTQRDLNKEFRLPGVALTRSGQELSRIVDLEPADQYALDLREYFEKNDLKMAEVPSREPQLTSLARP